MSTKNPNDLIVTGGMYVEDMGPEFSNYHSGLPIDYYLEVYSSSSNLAQNELIQKTDTTPEIFPYEDEVLNSEYLINSSDRENVIDDSNPVNESSANEIDNIKNLLNLVKRWARNTSIAVSASSLVFVPLMPDCELYESANNKTQSFNFSHHGTIVRATYLDEDYFDRIFNLLKESPVEDGESHPVENLISELLSNNMEAGWQLISNFSFKQFEDNPIIAADFLQCLSRINNKFFNFSATSLAFTALYNPETEIRESGIRILESIRTRDALSILTEYLQSETSSRLRKYAAQVINELQN